MGQANLPKLPCLCGTLRRAARTLTQTYDEAMRPIGLRATQFTILQALSLAGEIRQDRLAEVLAMDSTTLTRTLKLLRKEDVVAFRKGKDRRERKWRLTEGGVSRFEGATLYWEKVQGRVKKKIGEPAWKELFSLSDQVAALATMEGERS